MRARVLHYLQQRDTRIALLGSSDCTLLEQLSYTHTRTHCKQSSPQGTHPIDPVSFDIIINHFQHALALNFQTRNL
jgi:hypothetical protein